MKFLNEYRDPELAKRLIDRINHHSTRPTRLMEFCGGHTVAIFKHGIRQLLPQNIETRRWAGNSSSELNGGQSARRA